MGTELDPTRSFEVDRREFPTTRVVTRPPAELAPSQIRLAIKRLALKTNNVTYTVAGDMAGSGTVRTSVHTHFTERLTVALTVGVPHREDSTSSSRLPGPNPEFFFAPGQVSKCTDNWGDLPPSSAAIIPPNSTSNGNSDDVKCRRAPFACQGKRLRWLRDANIELDDTGSGRVDMRLVGGGCGVLFPRPRASRPTGTGSVRL